MRPPLSSKLHDIPAHVGSDIRFQLVASSQENNVSRPKCLIGKELRRKLSPGRHAAGGARLGQESSSDCGWQVTVRLCLIRAEASPTIRPRGEDPATVAGSFCVIKWVHPSFDSG